MSSPAEKPKIRFVLVTCGHAYADEILADLSLRGVVPEAILTAHVPSAPRRRTLRNVIHGGLGRLQRKLESPAAPADSRQARWGTCVRQIIDVGALNSDKMVRTLQRLEPDLLVLAQCGIVKAASLDIPRLGTINAHPALLPFLRGVGVVEHSLLQSIPVGVTTHFVNTGIDTGDVIRRELIPVTDIDTLESLRGKTIRRCKEQLVEITLGMIREGAVPPSYNQTIRTPCYKAATPDETQRAGALVQDGTALKLYQRWREQVGSDVLPLDESIRIT